MAFKAWLRGRRKGVPSTEEVLQSLAIMQMKTINAKKVAEENPFVIEPSEIPEATPKFPVLREYEHPDNSEKK